MTMVKARTGRGARRIACVLASLPFVPGIAVAQTAAGAAIVNTATLTYGAQQSVASNTVTLRVASVIDVAVTARTPALPVAAGATAVAVPFVVANAGNTTERFTLSAQPAATTIASDDDGDGAYDPAHDATLSTIALDAGATRTIFVVLPGPVAATATVALTATATTGHGAPGSIVGSAGAEAIVGAHGASASAQTIVTIGDAPATLVKSQSVLAPDGSARVMPGAVVTYRLDARFAAALPDAAIADAVPAGTTYVAGSITLDGQAMTDAADGDAASFDGTSVRIALGDVPAAAMRSVQFRTRIK